MVCYILINNALVILGLWVWDLGPISVWVGFGTAIGITFIGYMTMLFCYMDWTQIKELKGEDTPRETGNLVTDDQNGNQELPSMTKE